MSYRLHRTERAKVEGGQGRQAKRLLALGVLLGAGLVVSGCSGGSSDPGSLSVELKEWRVAMSKATVPAGKVTITARNLGTQEHEIVVLKTDLAPDALVLRGDKVDEDKSGDNIGEIEEDDLPPGKSFTKEFNLPPGKYAIVCNVAGHYTNGMHAPLTVTG